jgi:hypothetical protein
LLVTGKGAGKSHLLAEVCDHAIAEDRPAILIMGSKLPDGEPWAEIFKDLGLGSDYPKDRFLGALNAAGQAAGVRCLLMVDALNERNGRSIWCERLAGVLHDVAQYEWISLILSCRSGYTKLIIPESLTENVLPTVEHEGFTEEEARAYLRKRECSG